MTEPTTNIVQSNLIHTSCQRILQFPLRARFDTAQNGFELRDALLNRIEIRRVCWQIFYSGTGLFNQADGIWAMMKFNVIQQHHIAGEQLGNQEMLDINVKHGLIHRPFNHHGGTQPTQTERINNRNVDAVSEWFSHFCTLAFWGTSISACKRCINAEFVNKDQARRFKAPLLFSKGGALFCIGFRRDAGLFFRVSDNFSNPRQMVLTLTLTRIFFLR